MKLLLLGRAGGITHWLEDVADALGLEGHEVRIAVVRRPWLNAGLERALAPPIAARIAASAKRFGPDLIIAIGGFHTPRAILERLRALPGRPPMVGWVGDLFDATAAPLATLYDLVGYTDSGLAALHVESCFASRAIFLPHAANPRGAGPAVARDPRMVFAAAATPSRRKVVAAIAKPIVVHGPGWSGLSGRGHEIHAGRIAHAAVTEAYRRHLAVLNIRNERNVLHGLNQRNFDPCVAATPILTDAQADLERCFDPGHEVLVWRDVAELNATYDRLLNDPRHATSIGEAGRRRVMAEHLFQHRLSAILAAL